MELLVSFLDRKFHLYLGDDNPYQFIIDVIRFSTRSLAAIDANYKEFYDNMTTKESVFVLLTKLINHDNGIESYNGFPIDFNFEIHQTNKIQTYENSKWYPYIQGRYNIPVEQILTNAILTLGVDPNKLYFHSTNWEGGLSIMDRVRTRTRGQASDFGLENFYLTDSFKAAHIWANRNTQSTISIFEISNEYLENLENGISFGMDGIDEWKEFVFKVRNPPRSGRNLARRIDEYETFITDVDSKDLISGPIFANPGTRLVQNVEYVQYTDGIPFQYSFKRSSVDYLNQCLVVTIFFRER